MLRKFMRSLHKQNRIDRLLGLGARYAEGGEQTDVSARRRPQQQRGSGGAGGGGCGEAGEKAACCPAGADGGQQERSLVKEALHRLELDALKMLCEVIESRGDTLGSCVTVSKHEYPLRSKSATAAVLFCRYFRWPEVDCAARLRRLFVCRTGGDDCHDCINPYHWSRVYSQVPESWPPPVCGTKLSSLPAERRLSDESETVAPVSQTTGGTYSTCDGDERTWCKLVYWERRRPVCPPGGWRARDPVLNVFYNLPHEDGVALQHVCERNNPSPEQDVVNTRAKIGAGLSLSMEPSGVWLYNRSQRPLFVSSPALDPPDVSPDAGSVHKLPPGYSARVFSWSEDSPCSPARRRHSPNGPHDPYTVVVSFAKGWGAEYTRRTVLECPCRLELSFTPPDDRGR